MNSTNESIGGVCASRSARLTYKYWINIGWYVYTLVMVIYSIGTIGNLLSLLAFRKQVKSTGEIYLNQLFIIILDMLQILFYVLAEVGYAFLGVWGSSAPDFIQKSQFLLLGFALCYSFASMAATSALVFINGVCMDRLYALYKPMNYKTLKHKTVALFLLLFSLFVGIISSIQSVVTKRALWVDSIQHYIVVIDPVSFRHPLRVFFAIFLIVMRGVLTILLFVLVILISQKYNSINKTTRTPKVNKNSSSRSTAMNRPINERTLTALLLAQAFLTLLGMSGSMSYYIVVGIVKIPWCNPLALVEELIWAVSIAIQQSANFFLYIGTSKKFRAAVISVVTGQEFTPEGTTVHRHTNSKPLQVAPAQSAH